jgi:hypothetical protein
LALVHGESPEPAVMPLLRHLQKSVSGDVIRWKANTLWQTLLVCPRHASVPSVRSCNRSYLCFKICELIFFISTEDAKLNDYTFCVKD